MGEQLLLMKGIGKSFNGIEVLKHVDLDINTGEVHALMGENGAGKSTLIKILTGIYPKDTGTIIFNGKEVSIESRTDSAACGIAVIYQELSLIPTLTVTQNVMLGKEPGKFGVLNTAGMRKKVKALIDHYDFKLNPDAVVETLSIAHRQTVEILKALSEDARLIIMDEPTASLSTKESEILFSIIEQLRKKEVSVLYISHRLEEVFRLADRLTVLRDGVKVGVLEKGEIDPHRVIHMMIGKDLSASSASHPMRKTDTEPVIEVKELSRRGVFRDITFSAHKGEILGIGGLVGSGRTEVIRCIFGADPVDSGEICYNGKPLSGNTHARIRQGIGLIPEDRRLQGFVPLLSIERNVASTNYDQLTRFGIVNTMKEKMMGLASTKKLDIRPANPLIQVGNLSGGNQQKVVLGKWLARNLKVLLVDEATAGIDVGAKDEIYKLLESLAAQGVTIIVVSSDLEELIRISTRILVFRSGRIFREFSDGFVTQEDILEAASGIQKETEEA
ncbi:sugar ABC transporter ATP-binding protein [Treponema primitia]|uniref:sugar ABC transporter ATP-binding protein n=1 Tax=Treponema primitia TaxID=88058 RepID=UPI00397F3B28